MKIQIFFSSAFLIAGVILSGISLYNNQPLVALSLLLAGAYTAIALLFGVGNSLSDPRFQITAALIGILGLVGVFLYNKAFDRNLQGAYYDVLSDMATMELRCSPMSKELANVQNFGITACAVQGNSDQMGAVVELGKGLHFGPTLTIIDTSVAQTTGQSPNYCARAFKAADELCKSAFFSLDSKSKRALLDAAK